MRGQSKATDAAPAPGEPAVYDVPGFCKAHHIARSYFYAMRKAGKGPRVFKVGRRTLIASEEAARWRRSLQDPQDGAATAAEPGSCRSVRV